MRRVKFMFEDEGVWLRFFDKKEYLDAFRNGEIRMMSTYYYKHLEKRKLDVLYNNKFDSLENSLYVLNRNPKEKEMPNNMVKIYTEDNFGIEVSTKMKLCNPIIISNDELDKEIKMSCYYVIPSNEIMGKKFSYILDTMKDELGKYYCIIIDKEKFITKFAKAIRCGLIDKTIKKALDCDYAKYKDEKSYNGRWNPLLKPLGLSWQKEFRFLLQTKKEDPFYIKLGDIKNITGCGLVNDLKDSYVESDGTIVINNLQR